MRVPSNVTFTRRRLTYTFLPPAATPIHLYPPAGGATYLLYSVTRSIITVDIARQLTRARCSLPAIMPREAIHRLKYTYGHSRCMRWRAIVIPAVTAANRHCRAFPCRRFHTTRHSDADKSMRTLRDRHHRRRQTRHRPRHINRRLALISRCQNAACHQLL